MHDACGNPVKEKIVEDITSWVYGNLQIAKMAVKILKEELSTLRFVGARTKKRGCKLNQTEFRIQRGLEEEFASQRK